jgi:hypothetical protein
VSSTTFFSSLWIWAASAPESSTIVQQNACLPNEADYQESRCRVVVMRARRLDVQSGETGASSVERQQWMTQMTTPSGQLCLCSPASYWLPEKPVLGLGRNELPRLIGHTHIPFAVWLGIWLNYPHANQGQRSQG